MAAIKSYYKLLTALAILISSISFSSCKKNVIDASGQFNIKVVNAAANSGPQSFTLANAVIISGGLDFTDASAYINAPSGKNMTMEFKDSEGSVDGTGSLYTTSGVSFTVYLAGKGSNGRVKSFEDNLDTPNNGKVKIKFIHLSDAAPSVINIRNANGDNLVTTLARDVSSGYQYVDPGTLSVGIFDIVSKDNIANFSFANLQEGKIYSLYLTDNANGTIIMNELLHN